MPDAPATNQLTRRAVTERLGRLYRHGRLLRRLLRLLDEADRLGLPITTANRLPAPPNTAVVPGDCETPDELAALIEEQEAENAEESRRHKRRHEPS